LPQTPEGALFSAERKLILKTATGMFKIFLYPKPLKGLLDSAERKFILKTKTGTFILHLSTA
jgi:hypothetical protein